MGDVQDIQAVIWDFGGVILRTEDHSGRIQWEARLGLDPGGLSRLVFAGEMGWQAALGRATSDEVWAWTTEKLGLPVQDRRILERDFWSGDRLDHDLVEFIRGLRQGRKTGLISNAWPDLRREIEGEWHIADAFDDIVISAEVGMVKPDPRIYRLSLKNLGVDPSASVFIDDSEENVTGARAVGMQAIQFTNPAQAIATLRSMLGEG